MSFLAPLFSLSILTHSLLYVQDFDDLSEILMCLEKRCPSKNPHQAEITKGNKKIS